MRSPTGTPAGACSFSRQAVLAAGPSSQLLNRRCCTVKEAEQPYMPFALLSSNKFWPSSLALLHICAGKQALWLLSWHPGWPGPNCTGAG